MKYILILTLFMNFAYSQTNRNHSFVGKWKAIENSNFKATQNSDMKELLDIFKACEMEFNPNGNFKLVLKSQNHFAAELREMTKETRWEYDDKRNIIIVSSIKNNDVIIGFEYFTKNKEHFFKLLESEIILKVMKIKS